MFTTKREYFSVVSAFVLFAPTLVVIYCDYGDEQVLFVYNFYVVVSVVFLILYMNEALWAVLDTVLLLLDLERSRRRLLVTVAADFVAINILQWCFLVWVRTGVAVSVVLRPYVFSNVNLAIYSLWNLPRLLLCFQKHSNEKEKPPIAVSSTTNEKDLQAIVAFERQRHFYFRRHLRDRLHTYEQLQQLECRSMYPRDTSIRPFPLTAKPTHSRLSRTVNQGASWKVERASLSPNFSRQSLFPVVRMAANEQKELCSSTNSSTRTLVSSKATISPVSSTPSAAIQYVDFGISAITAPYRFVKTTLSVVSRVHFNCLIVWGYWWTLVNYYLLGRKREKLPPLQLVESTSSIDCR